MKKKSKRQLVHDKFNGLCAYSGTPLESDWQIDHVNPKRDTYEGDLNHIDNLVPTQKIINHYKRALNIELFRTWYLGDLHLRLKKLPKEPKVERSIKRKAYILKVASYFNITEDKPFTGKFYFESNTNKS